MVRSVPVLGLLGHYHGHSSAVFHGHLPQQILVYIIYQLVRLEKCPRTPLCRIQFSDSRDGWRSQSKEVMASSTIEKSAKSMGRGKEGARRAQEDRAGAERAAGGASDPRITVDARGSRRQEAYEPSRLDVLSRAIQR